MAIDIKFCQQLPDCDSATKTDGWDVLDLVAYYGVRTVVLNSSRLGNRWFRVELEGVVGSDFALSVASDSLRDCARLLHKLLTLSSVIVNSKRVDTSCLATYSRFADELERRYASEFPSN